MGLTLKNGLKFKQLAKQPPTLNSLKLNFSITVFAQSNCAQ